MKKLISIYIFATLLIQPVMSQSDFGMEPVQMRLTLLDEIPVLEWDSWHEVNTSYYIIEKQTGSEPFVTVATLKAGGSTYGLKQYQFEDVVTDSTAPANYRITLVWMDGTRQSWTMNQDFTATK